MPLDRQSAIIAGVATHPKPPEHRTKVRQRRDLWVTSCSCDWSEKTVSNYSARLAMRRHLEQQASASSLGGPSARLST